MASIKKRENEKENDFHMFRYLIKNMTVVEISVFLVTVLSVQTVISFIL